MVVVSEVTGEQRKKNCHPYFQYLKATILILLLCTSRKILSLTFSTIEFILEVKFHIELSEWDILVLMSSHSIKMIKISAFKRAA